MKRLITSLLTLLLIISASATVKEREFEHRVLLNVSGSTETSIQNYSTQSDYDTLNNRANRNAKRYAKGDETVEVKCIFKYDRDNYHPSLAAIRACNVDNRYYGWFDEADECVYMTMIPGVYDFRANFIRISENSKFLVEDCKYAGYAYLILEDVEVSGDMEIEFDASLITETISFETYNPDGEKTALRYVRYFNDEDYEIINEGNVADYFINNYIFHEYETYSLTTNAFLEEVELGPIGEWKAEWSSNIYVNPVSDKYQFVQLRLAYNDDESWIIPMFANGSKTQIVTNKGDKYSDKYNIKFENTPTGKDNVGDIDYPYIMRRGIGLGLDYPGSFSETMSILPEFHNFQFCQTETSKSHPEYNINLGFGQYDTEEAVIRSPMFIMGEKSSCLYPSLMNGVELYNLEGGETYYYYPAQLGYEVSPQNLPIFGSSPQFLQFFYRNRKFKWTENITPYLIYTSNGYYYDVRDYIEGDINVSINGNTVATSAEELAEWQISAFDTPMEMGELVFDYVNANIEVDGLAGKNTAKVCINTAAENFSMPLIQSVQFRDLNSCVKYQFKDASEGELWITGGDFREMKDIGSIDNSGDNPMWYDIEDCNLIVEYAPHGSNNFSGIEVTKEGDAMLAYGYLYKGNLESVDQKSSTGWFDLRMLMTDAAGNTHEQIISPAFKIDKLTGVQQVCANKANIRIIGRTVVADNNALVEVFTLSGQRVVNNNLSSGIYMARSGDSIAKLVVK